MSFSNKFTHFCNGLLLLKTQHYCDWLIYFFQILRHVVTLSEILVSVLLTSGNTIMIPRQKPAKNLYMEAAEEMKIDLILPKSA